MLSPEETAQYQRLRDIIARLRAPDGCPWDREQTHASLRPHLLQESYEVLALLDAGDASLHLAEEMGDLLFQILIHTQLAEEAGEFTMTDVVGGLADKLVRRHPHVFGDAEASTSGQVLQQWEELKRKERPADASALSGVPAALPAAAYAQELLRRAEAAGFAWPHRDDVLEKLQEEIAELAEAKTKEDQTAEFGDILFNVVNYARYLGIDAEEALRESGHKFRRRFNGVEDHARADGIETLKGLSREELMSIWARVKADEPK
jgi:tetrapyrrole methylase family protein/MazG family protein